MRQPFRAALPEVGVRVVDHVGEPRVDVAAEDLGGFVGGPVVGDHEVVHSERVVEAEVGLEDVAFVSNLERHDQALSPALRMDDQARTGHSRGGPRLRPATNHRRR